MEVSDSFVGGRLKLFLPVWQKLTQDSSILQLVSGAKIEFSRQVRQNFPRKPINCSGEEKTKIDSEIVKYEKLRIVETADHSSGEFISQIFSTPKRSGGVRIILNLKPLNQDVIYKHFKMENLFSVLKLMEKNCFMASIDLKDAYYSVNIHESYRKYLRFLWNDRLYQFTCLPNGLTSAPRWFTKLMKPIFSKLRNQGFISVYYLDDTWLMGKTELDCGKNIEATCKLLKETGFLLNLEKSHMQPSQIVNFLGFQLNSINMTVNLTSDKREKIVNLCGALLHNSRVSIRFLAQVIGVLVSSLPAVQFGELFYRYLEADKIAALKKAAGNFDAIMCISPNAKAELQWWIKNASTTFRPIHIPPHTCFITTDASKFGWGAVFNGRSTGGRWSADESQRHINELELLAINFGLKSFLNDVLNEHIRIRTDNSTAVAYINKFGGVKSLKCHEIVKDIWLWAFERDVYLTAEHLPGSENTTADTASRIFSDNTEWSLDTKVFAELVVKFGKFSIDLFASRLNSKLDNYVAWKPDPCAVFIDAFSREWSRFPNFYAFPPFSIIMRCLQKITVEEAQGVLITPLWPTQPWFPKLMKMLIAPPLVLPPNILRLPFNSSRSITLPKNMNLLASPISGKASEIKAFQKSLLLSCVHPGGPPQLNNMNAILKSGFISVIDEKLIPCNIMKLML